MLEVAPHVFEVDTIRPQRRALIEEDWNREFAGDTFAGIVRQGHTIFHRHTAYRNEGQHISRAKAWMYPLVLTHVD